MFSIQYGHIPVLPVVWPVLCRIYVLTSDHQIEEINSSVIFLYWFHFEVYMTGTDLAENFTIIYFPFIENI